MQLQLQPLPFSGSLPGLSERLLASHHQNNYGGAVKRLNAIRAELAQRPPESLAGFALNGLKREELIATNSMLLHELHFACLGGDGEQLPPAMELALAANFGTSAAWEREFVAMGKALAGGSGWVLLCFEPRTGSLVNQWASDHSQSIAGAVPILALDMYEHAYHMDFGAQAGAWVEAFMRNIDWGAVYARYRLAVEGATSYLAGQREDLQGALLVDVRRRAVYEAAPGMIPGAQWRDPARVDEWAGELGSGRAVIVYCIQGHEVSRRTALRLRAHGLQARFLAGGMDGWTAVGPPAEPKAGA